MNQQTIKGVFIGVAFTMAISFTGVTEASTNALKGYFKDSGWWSASAEWARDAGLMNGYGNQVGASFAGDKYITRGELAQVLKNLDTQGKFVSTQQPNVVAEPSTSSEPYIISMSTFEKMTVGMSLKDVTALVGGVEGNIQQSG